MTGPPSYHQDPDSNLWISTAWIHERRQQETRHRAYGTAIITEKAVSKHAAGIFAKLDLAQSDDNRRVLAVLAYLESVAKLRPAPGVPRPNPAAGPVAYAA